MDLSNAQVALLAAGHTYDTGATLARAQKFKEWLDRQDKEDDPKYRTFGS